MKLLCLSSPLAGRFVAAVADLCEFVDSGLAVELEIAGLVAVAALVAIELELGLELGLELVAVELIALPFAGQVLISEIEKFFIK